MQVAAFRHAMKERAKRGVILPRRLELRSGDDRVEFAGEEGKAEQEDERRQEDGGKDDPASQDFCPGCALYEGEASGWVWRTQLGGGASGSSRLLERSVPVMIGFIRSLDGHADILGLPVRHFRELGADLGEVQACDLLVEVLRQRVNFLLVLLRIGP